ncbi:MAG: hypothetical protein PHW18_07995 [Sulfuricurvum sp.]|uniref:hypothetical protein n=1 Tax=Sulfuricurvum sp. TaxID=2025608 RepID=UPI002612ECC9|nr:hypothetical protein [Sulfuricurvum sp.]MDD2829497.1 hypothetical protein [Sulfuricurvum sp.]MDD4949506.1 hypothetical protein [Sulfuricurvum sp.]
MNNEETYLKLQYSENTIAHMASRLLAAYVTSAQLTPSNESELIDRSVRLAIKLAYTADKLIESDNENSE